MRKPIATIIGFLIAPLIAAVALVATGAAKSGSDILDMSALLWVAIYYCFTISAALLIGLPSYLLLAYFNKVTWWSTILVGMFGGAVMSLIFLPLNLLILLIGGLSGLVFWLIWRQGIGDAIKVGSTSKLG